VVEERRFDRLDRDVELVEDVLLPRRQSRARAEVVLAREERVVELARRERRPRDSVDPEEKRGRDHAAQEKGMPAADQKAKRGSFSLCVAADSRSRRMARVADADKREAAANGDFCTARPLISS
jgi:hypothetical protein